MPVRAAIALTAALGMARMAAAALVAAVAMLSGVFVVLAGVAFATIGARPRELEPA